MSIKDKADYTKNKVDYGVSGAMHGVFSVLKAIFFLPNCIFGFLYFHPFISAVILFFVTGALSTRYFIYPHAHGFFDMLRRASANPNGFFNGGNNMALIIALAVIFTAVLTLINKPLGKMFTGIYTTLRDADDTEKWAMGKSREKDIYYKSKAKAENDRNGGAEELDEFKKKLDE